MSISNRGKLRRKLVLPITVIRENGEKHLAHTLDVTETSARLGGLNVTLEPGETIEIQRGGLKAKFNIYWVGEPGTELEGQAGIRGIDPNKCIWSAQLPSDQPDLSVDPIFLRGQPSPKRLLLARTAEPHAEVRYECSAGINLRAPGSIYPFRAQLKSIHVTGFYVESITTLPLNTVVSVEMHLEGVALETSGRVTASTHRVGMEISFHKPSPEVRRKVVAVLQRLRQKAWDAQPVPAAPHNPFATAPGSPTRAGVARGGVEAPAPAANSRPVFHPEEADAGRVLVTLCKLLLADFESWKAGRTSAELGQLSKALAELQDRLSPGPALDICEYLAEEMPAEHGQA
jgi:hypothetical protein